MPKPGKPGFGGHGLLIHRSQRKDRKARRKPGLFRFGRKRGASDGMIAPCVHGAPFDRLRHAAAMSLRL
jgi:hypothetical protein